MNMQTAITEENVSIIIQTRIILNSITANDNIT